MLLSALCWTPTPIRAQPQPPADIVIIGDSPQRWQQFQTYWENLLQLNRPQSLTQEPPPFPAPPPIPTSPGEPEILANLVVQDLLLQPIIKLNGSSQVIGVLTNLNPVPVRVASVNFAVVDALGKILRTGSARPEPSTLQPGQSVTFSQTLLTIPPDIGAQVRLLEPAFSLD